MISFDFEALKFEPLARTKGMHEVRNYLTARPGGPGAPGGSYSRMTLDSTAMENFPALNNSYNLFKNALASKIRILLAEKSLKRQK